MTTITSVLSLPGGPYNGSGKIGIVITSGIPCYYQVTGSDLQDIVSVNWYPKNPGSVLFTVRNLIFINNTQATFMIQVIDNYLDISDRGGNISFRLSDGTTLSVPAITYGRSSVMPLWRAPGEGLITG